MKKIPLHKFLWIAVCWLLEALIGLVAYVLFFLIAVGIYKYVIRGTSVQEGLIAFGLGTLAGMTGALVSLIPSYLFSLRLAKWVEKKWEIEIKTPGKLYALSLLIPFLFFLALFFFFGS